MALAVDGTVERLNEPDALDAYRDVFARVARDERPVIIQAHGRDLAVVVPMDLLVPMLEVQAQRVAEAKAAGIDWSKIDGDPRNFQDWLHGDEPKPF